MKKLKNYLINMFNKHQFEEGYVYILIKDVDKTNNPSKYSEGIFAWCENGALKTSLDFHQENGGDPIVFKKYILKNSI